MGVASIGSTRYSFVFLMLSDLVSSTLTDHRAHADVVSLSALAITFGYLHLSISSRKLVNAPIVAYLVS